MMAPTINDPNSAKNYLGLTTVDPDIEIEQENELYNRVSVDYDFEQAFTYYDLDKNKFTATGISPTYLPAKFITSKVVCN